MANFRRLSDAAALDKALEHVASQSSFTGRIKGLTARASARNGYAVALVFAESEAIEAAGASDAAAGAVRTAYRDVLC